MNSQNNTPQSGNGTFKMNTLNSPPQAQHKKNSFNTLQSSTNSFQQFQLCQEFHKIEFFHPEFIKLAYDTLKRCSRSYQRAKKIFRRPISKLGTYLFQFEI